MLFLKEERDGSLKDSLTVHSIIFSKDTTTSAIMLQYLSP